MQKLNINFLKFTRARQFTSKDGTEFVAIPLVENNITIHEKGLFLNLTMFENKDGKDRYENDGFIAVDVSKEARESGVKGPIIGNWKYPKQKAVNLTGPKNRPPVDLGEPDNAPDDIPF